MSFHYLEKGASQFVRLGYSSKAVGRKPGCKENITARQGNYPELNSAIVVEFCSAIAIEKNSLPWFHVSSLKTWREIFPANECTSLMLEEYIEGQL